MDWMDWIECDRSSFLVGILPDFLCILRLLLSKLALIVSSVRTGIVSIGFY